MYYTWLDAIALCAATCCRVWVLKPAQLVYKNMQRQQLRQFALCACPGKLPVLRHCLPWWLILHSSTYVLLLQELMTTSKEASQLRIQLEEIISMNNILSARLDEANRSNANLQSTVAQIGTLKTVGNMRTCES